MSIDDRTQERTRLVVAALEGAGVPYAVGGALCYGFHSEPRATTDIDIDVFLDPSEAKRVIDVLEQPGVTFPPDAAQTIETTGQIRSWIDVTFVDLFFAHHEFFESCHQRARRVNFIGTEMNILELEDLVVFKCLFDRPKDWFDLHNLVVFNWDTIDLDYIEHWLSETVGSDDSRIPRIRELVQQARANPPDFDSPTAGSGSGR